MTNVVANGLYLARVFSPAIQETSLSRALSVSAISIRERRFTAKCSRVPTSGAGKTEKVTMTVVVALPLLTMQDTIPVVPLVTKK